MEKFIPYEKLSKKERKKANAQKRSQFAMANMNQRMAQNEKKYNRTKQKAQRNDDFGPFALIDMSARSMYNYINWYDKV